MRNINSQFVNDLLFGDLSYFLTQVKSKRNSLSLEIRNGYVNIYYKGGNLLKITQKSKGYSFYFDAKYCKHKSDTSNFELLNSLKSDDLSAYKKYFFLMMEEMDSWFKANPKAERDYQHQLLVNNPEIVDIEYQVGKRMRLDMLVYVEGRLLIVENKYGTGAISGKAGVSEHYKDICEVLTDTKLREEMVASVCHISHAKKALGLTNYTIDPTNIKSIELLFLLANYNLNSQSLSNEINKMNGAIPANILMTAGEQVKLDLGSAKNIFAGV